MRNACKSMLAACLVAAGLGVGGPAHAANVSVTFELSAGTASPPGPALARCALSVPAGSSGRAVLDAAARAGCISSHSGSEDPRFGYFVECINGLCGTPVTYWAFYVNDASSPVGVDAYKAAAGDEVEFSYQTWLGCLTPVGCDPVPHG